MNNDEVNLLVISGHQPAYLPWLGYFHKLLVCDIFVYMDDVQFIERGYIHRNKIKIGRGRDCLLTLPINKKNRYDVISKVEFAQNFWQRRHFETICNAYRRAPYFEEYYEDLKNIYIETEWELLSDLTYSMLKLFNAIIGIDSVIVKGSDAHFTRKKSDLVLEHCQRFNARIVLVGMMGRHYIDEEEFKKNGIMVNYQDYRHPAYPQLHGDFVPYMSFLDLLFNVKREELRATILMDNLKREDLVNAFFA